MSNLKSSGEPILQAMMTAYGPTEGAKRYLQHVGHDKNSTSLVKRNQRIKEALECPEQRKDFGCFRCGETDHRVASCPKSSVNEKGKVAKKVYNEFLKAKKKKEKLAVAATTSKEDTEEKSDSSMKILKLGLSEL